MRIEFTENLVKRSVGRVAVTVGWGVIGGDVAQTKTSVDAIIFASSGRRVYIAGVRVARGSLHVGFMVGISGGNSVNGAGGLFLWRGHLSP